MHIECDGLHVKGGLLPLGRFLITLKFLECHLTEVEHCTVAEPIEAKTSGELVNEPVEAEAKPEGTSFATIKLEGAECPAKGEYPVTGTQTCKLPGIGTEAVEHEILCEESGSKLKLGGKSAFFKGPAISDKLESGEKWSAN